MEDRLLSWMTAIGTLLSALIALIIVFYSELKHEFGKARFKMGQCVINEKTTIDALVGRVPAEYVDSAEMKILIEQVSGDPAQDVEVILVRILRYTESGETEAWPYYISQNLTWGESKNRKIAQTFSKGLFRYCNLGTYGMDPEGEYGFRLATAEVFGDPITNTLSTCLPCGKYALEIIITGHGVVCHTKTLILNVTGAGGRVESAQLDVA